jgi:hypothetical protein
MDKTIESRLCPSNFTEKQDGVWALAFRRWVADSLCTLRPASQSRQTGDWRESWISISVVVWASRASGDTYSPGV